MAQSPSKKLGQIQPLQKVARDNVSRPIDECGTSLIICDFRTYDFGILIAIVIGKLGYFIACGIEV